MDANQAAKSNAKATSRYALRKAARLRGRPMQSRYGQSPPWYCWPGSAYTLERKIEKFAVFLPAERRY